MLGAEPWPFLALSAQGPRDVLISDCDPKSCDGNPQSSSLIGSPPLDTGRQPGPSRCLKQTTVHKACFTESCLSIPSQWLFVLGSNCVTENLEVPNMYSISKVLQMKFLQWKKRVPAFYTAYFTMRCSLKEAGNDLVTVYRTGRYFLCATNWIVSLRFSYLCFDCSSSGFCMHFWRGLFWSGPSTAEPLWFVGYVHCSCNALLLFFFLFHFYALKVTSFSLSFLKIKTFPADTSNPFFDPFTTVPQFSVSRMCNWKAVYLTRFQGII